MVTKNIHPLKAYENQEFMGSPDARIIRVLCEFMEPKTRLKKNNVKDTIVFFGSSRVCSTAQCLAEMEALKKEEKLAKGERKEEYRDKIREMEKLSKLSKYYDDACELSRLLTVWSMNLSNTKYRFLVASGGGNGIMEAACKGATYLARGKSIGFNISLPHEQVPNPYISPDLNFEFHYFFIRKFWFIYLAKALVIFPGGYGTLDELMEVLTLVQTNKVKKRIPIVIYGSEYWNQVINFDTLVRMGTIDERDRNLFKFANSPKEAFNYLSKELTKLYL
jgi:uncharacterized protein (TIGR00730 family)